MRGEMKILDANVGVGPWWTKDAILPSEPAEILAILDACGVDEAIIQSNLVHSPSSAVDINRATVALASAFPRFRPAFLLTPHPYDHLPKPADYAESMRAAGARVAWLRPAAQQHGVWTWLVGDLLGMCEDTRLPLFMPIDSLSPNDIHQMCDEFPSLRLVLTNLGYRSDIWLYPLLRRHPELRICLGHTYIPPLGPELFVRHFGPQRMIFGSALPHFTPGGLVGMVNYSTVSDADKALIFAGNMERLMDEVRL
jgi:predicted TIM-barrel fold metal-dependent hydrolase